MKIIVFILSLVIIILNNYTFSQSKTPYEKKVEDIYCRFFRALEIDESIILTAKKTGDWELILSSKEFSYAANSLNKTVFLASMMSLDAQMKEAEKLKNDIDFKKQKEENERLALEQKNQKELNRYSDLEKIKNDINSHFSKWVKKGEFENNDDYQVRINNKEKTINKITYYIVNKRVNLLHDNYQRYYIELKNYDPDKQFYPVILVRRIYNEEDQLDTYQDKNVTINDTLLVNIEFAKKIKQKSTSDRFNIGSDVSIIWLDNRSIFFSRNINNWIINSNGFFFPKKYSLFEEYIHSLNTLNTSLDKLILNTNDLGLQEYFPNNYIIDFAKSAIKTIDFNSDIRRDKIIKQADKLSIQQNKLEAYQLFQEANQILYTDDVKSKISEIEPIVIREQEELIESAKKDENNGEISSSIEKLETADKLKTKDELITKINSLKIERDKSLIKYKLIDSILKIAELEKLNFYNEIGKQRSALDELKDGYGQKYLFCTTKIESKIYPLWSQIENSNSEVNYEGERRVRFDKSTDLLQKIDEFRNELKKYSKFEINLKKALIEKDKKYLKIFKEEDENLIVETIIKTN